MSVNKTSVGIFKKMSGSGFDLPLHYETITGTTFEVISGLDPVRTQI